MSDYDDPVVGVLADVFSEADDDRLPDDTLWFSDGCTLADELSARIRDLPQWRETDVDLEDVLDELDVEVPTAALLVETDNDGYHLFHGTNQADSYYSKKKRVARDLNKPNGWIPDELNRDELHRSEDVEEALEEAVQQARQQERRRILEKIDNLRESYKEEIDRIERKHLLSDSELDHSDANLLRKFEAKKIDSLRELEEEVKASDE
ncbi:hypothetical protein [Haloferax sp. Q22]|uniref:hypothetical protein n=1 Tax=Haloferax sp. (strain Q22) TaxID=1526048 RepID=UPI000A63F584|nr:hypothetical protein [Haloferax sp. Q22]